MHVRAGAIKYKELVSRRQFFRRLKKPYLINKEIKSLFKRTKQIWWQKAVPGFRYEFFLVISPIYSITLASQYYVRPPWNIFCTD